MNEKLTIRRCDSCEKELPENRVASVCYDCVELAIKDVIEHAANMLKPSEYSDV